MLSQAEFNKARAAAIASEPLTKPVKLSDITLSETSQKDGFINLGGTRVPASGNFFRQLASLLNINTTLSNKFEKNGDSGMGNKLIQAVKSYTQSRVGDMDLMLVADREKQSVTGVAKRDKYSRISNDTLFSTADQILNTVPNMHLESVDTGGGTSRINLIHTDEVGFERLGKDEVFRFGVSLVNTPTQTGIDDFFYRMVCANGAVAKDMTAAFQLKDLTPTSISELFDKLKAYSKASFVPKAFSEKLDRAMSTKASLLELEHALDGVRGNLKVEDPEFRKRIETSLIDQHFHSYKPTVARVFSKGYDTDSLTNRQKAFIKTDQSVWDLVNELTWLGSHNTGTEFQNRARFKAAGGQLFSKAHFDLEAAQFATI